MDKALIIQKYNQGYRMTEIAKLFNVSKQRIDHIVHYEKYLARQTLIYAVENGILQKQPCEVCGELNVQAHHDDYSKPLEVRWLCSIHHKELLPKKYETINHHASDMAVTYKRKSTKGKHCHWKKNSEDILH